MQKVNKKRLTQRERKLTHGMRVAEFRSTERAARKHRRYDPNRVFRISHEVKINKAVFIDGSKAGKVVVKAPPRLNFQGECKDTIKFLSEIQTEIVSGRTHNVLIDISLVEEISPAVAVVLLAEVTRCVFYARRVKRLQGNFPKTDRAKQVLTDVGFFRAFRVKSPVFTSSEASRVYVKTIAGNRSDGRYTRPLLNLFERVCGLPAIAGKRLYGALIECMDNVKGHAYPEVSGSRADLVGEWWMCGFADPVNDQLALVFYDLGEGIPTTIKRKKRIRFQSYLNFTDSRILTKAITVGLSSKQSPRRGTGLPSLREFVDFAPGGFLRVISGAGDVRYIGATRKIETRTLNAPLAGSLIVWTIRGNSTDMECEGDLQWPTGPVQLNFKYDQV